jgi:hypothetical protein
VSHKSVSSARRLAANPGDRENDAVNIPSGVCLYPWQFGGAWTPVFDSASARSGEGETHWVVGVTASELLCVVCRESQPLPAVHPRPVLSTLPLSIPLLPAADGSHMLEEYHVRTSLMLAQGAAANVTSLDCSTEVDRNLIKLFAAACKGEHDTKCRTTRLEENDLAPAQEQGLMGNDEDMGNVQPLGHTLWRRQRRR